MTRDMGQNIYAASSKNGKLFVADFSDSYLAISASVNDAKHQKPNSFITLMTRDMGQNMLPAVKTKNLINIFYSREMIAVYYIQSSEKQESIDEM